jgi:hypothetical protein
MEEALKYTTQSIASTKINRRIKWGEVIKGYNKKTGKSIYNSMVKSVLTNGAETWSLYEDDRRRVRATEMVALRRPTRISKLDRKTNAYIRGKMDAQDTILDYVTRKQLIWYGHVERMDPVRLSKIMIT